MTNIEEELIKNEQFDPDDFREPDEIDDTGDEVEVDEEDDMPLQRPSTPAARRKWDMALNRLKQRRHRAKLKEMNKITPLEKIEKEWAADRDKLPPEQLEALLTKEKEVQKLRKRISAFDKAIGASPGGICVEDRFAEDIVAEADQHNPGRLYADVQRFLAENSDSRGWNAPPKIFAEVREGERFPDWWDEESEPVDAFRQYGIDLKLGSEGKSAFWWYYVLNQTANPDLTAQFIAQTEKQLRDANADPNTGSKHTGDFEFYIFAFSSEARWVLQYLMDHGRAPKMTAANIRDHRAHLHPRRRSDLNLKSWRSQITASTPAKWKERPKSEAIENAHRD